MNKWKIHGDIWHFFDHGSITSPAILSVPIFLDLHLPLIPHSEQTMFYSTMPQQRNHISDGPTSLKVKYPTTGIHFGQHLWAPKWKKSCERALIQALWDHTYRIFIFRNNEDHKNDNRAIAQYKQRAIESRIAKQYDTFQNTDLPLNILQQSHFDITQETLIILSYDIRRVWLRSADLYIRHASHTTPHNYRARGSQAQYILHNTSGFPPYSHVRQ
jgi:hypothetical protein